MKSNVAVSLKTVSPIKFPVLQKRLEPQLRVYPKLDIQSMTCGESKPMIYDISRPVSGQIALWPGDEPYSLSHSATISGGGKCNVGILHMSLHMATHVDAPYHYLEAGETVEKLGLGAYCGIAAVVDARGHETITADLFDEVDLKSVPRLLIKTGVWVDHALFPSTFPVLAEGVADYLGSNGVKLVGFDVPSVDKPDAQTLVNHYALAENRILILESLDLGQVEPGLYELIALPLKIVGGDGSPVRAVLKDLSVTAPEGNRMLGQ